MKNTITMENPPCDKAKLLDFVGNITRKDLPAELDSLNKRLHGGMVLILVMIGQDYRPFAWVENCTGSKIEKYRKLVGQEVVLVSSHPKEKKDSDQQTLPLGGENA